MAYLYGARKAPTRPDRTKTFATADRPLSFVEKAVAAARAAEDELIARARYQAEHDPSPTRREEAQAALDKLVPPAPARVEKSASSDVEVEQFIKRLAADGNAMAQRHYLAVR